jgi:uncharacterized circularly permuted ATP-grasp superfamily protein
MGTVALVNAVGNGVADDKAVYAYVPDMIRYYLNEPILKTFPYQMENLEEREFVFADMGNMVIKETNVVVYGMVMGNKASEKKLKMLKLLL